MCDLESLTFPSHQPASLNSFAYSSEHRYEKIREQFETERRENPRANNREETMRSEIAGTGSKRRHYFHHLCIDSRYDFM